MITNKKGEKGDPGYTPIKDVDYSDGQTGQNGLDGQTPVKGVDYFDGQDGNDGITPVKGVDYFDGDPGLPGNDGITPVKGVDYFDGDPGTPGYTPIKGVDYFDGDDGAPGTPGPNMVSTATDTDITGILKGTGAKVAQASAGSDFAAASHGHAPSEVTGTAVITNDSRLSDTRDPKAHSHTPGDTTGTAVITNDARLSDTRDPKTHSHAPGDVTGTAVITNDARLSDTRDPKSHSHAESDVTGLATDLGNKVVVGGQIGGTAASPTVIGLTTTTPATLTLGAIVDGEYLKRVGTVVVSAVPAGAGDISVSKLAPAGDITIPAGYCALVCDYYEVASGKFLEVEAGAIMEVT